MFLAVALLVIVLGLLAYLDSRKPKNFPPGPRWWPLIGSAFEIMEARKRTGYLFQATAEMAEKYGPVLGLKFGRDKLVVVYGPEAVKEFLSSEDLSGRPHDDFYRMRTFGKRRGIILVDQNFWTEQRRFLLRHLREFGFGRKTMSSMIEDEAAHLVTYLKETIVKNDSVVFNVETLFNVPILNTIWKMMAGVRYHPDDKNMQELLAIMAKLFGTVDMTGALFSRFPILKYIAPEMSGYNIMVELHVRMYEVIGKMLEEHKRTHNPDDPRDLMDVYLTALKSENPGRSFSEQQLMAICLDMFMAGSETTSNSLTFGVLHLMLNQEAQNKAREEIDRVIGKERRPTLDDRPLMPYLECVVFETLRMFGGRVLTVPHRALKDTHLNGYFIPKDVQVIANLHGCMMRPENGFDDPEAFKPERYLKNGKIHLPETYMPFAMGKHRCMGETMARANVFLFLTTMIQNFEFSVVPDSPPDMKMVDGVTPGMKHFKARVVPRML
ncbi:unnamed protein product [Brassicogethes aeneus]|uniref:Cytochrome P450 n=1 Tax=Brassicogethes aeneus TaxID=1431903 RepID=A0A9P0FAE8_BRAAE|nr:unnamed protein product [Brassicogethes aeneus]